MRVQGHKLGVGYIRLTKHGGKLGVFYRTKREVMGWYVQAQTQGVEAYM